jgi:diguanylate cyclase (GGDEF)-like protein
MSHLTIFGAGFDLLQYGLPAPAALAIVALLGYVVGRVGRKTVTTPDQQVRREVQRAHGVARNLETIATAIRKDLARHRASLDRFKTRVGELGGAQTREDWQKLCAEAEHMLGPTMELAAQLAQAYDQIRRQTNHLMTFSEVRTDPLTGVCNRRAMDDTLASLVAMKNRYELGFSIALFDIDHFKKINDERGHLAGDSVLKDVARLLDQAARETDVVTRFGGEEFVVIMPQTDLAGGCVFAERVRGQIEKKLGLTVSGGVTAALGNHETPEMILQRADLAMYAAKEDGRNRTFYHDGRNVELNFAGTPKDASPSDSVTDCDAAVEEHAVAAS